MKEADILQVFILFNREKYFNCELLARLDEHILSCLVVPTRLHKSICSSTKDKYVNFDLLASLQPALS